MKDFEAQMRTMGDDFKIVSPNDVKKKLQYSKLKVEKSQADILFE